MLKVGDEVTFYDPGSVGSGHESWQRGNIERVLVQNRHGFAVHRVRLNAHKWIAGGEWGAYDGVPLVIGREVPGHGSQLQFCEVWREGIHTDDDDYTGWLEHRAVAPIVRQMGQNECSAIIGALMGGLYSSGMFAPETLRATLRYWADNESVWEVFRRAMPDMNQAAVDAIQKMKGGRR